MQRLSILLTERNRAQLEVGAPAIDLWGKTAYGNMTRQPEVVRWRRLVWKKMRSWCFSYPEIAMACGCSHVTVMDGCREPTLRGEQPE